MRGKNRDWRFSPRQIQILELMGTGASLVQVAETLGIGKGTVSSYLHIAYAELGARNAAEAVEFARAQGVIG